MCRRLLHKFKYVCLRENISVLVMGDAIDIVGYDRRTSELSNAPLHITQDTTRI